MRGTNPIRPPVRGDGLTLEVQHIFATIQGEGMYAGWPAIFIRLGGCNLACTFCDTEFESFQAISLDNILDKVYLLAGDVYRLAVITGGEPLRQPIMPLCERLLEKGLQVQIETNGTLYRPLPEGVDIICSPKNTGQGYAPVRPDLLRCVSALKFLISAQRKEYEDVANVGQSKETPIYVQPMDEHDPTKNAANTQRAIELAQCYGYRLSLQLHKIIGVE